MQEEVRMDEKRELVRRTMQIVKEIFQKNTRAVSYCKGNMEWRFNHMSGYGLYCPSVRKALQGCGGEDRWIRHHQYHVQTITEQVHLVSGLFCIVSGQDNVDAQGIRDSQGIQNSQEIRNSKRIQGLQGLQGSPYEIIVCMSGGMAECVHVYGVRSARLLCKVQGVHEEVFFLEQAEVLYIESAHNNVIWHCRGYQVESRDSLKRLEQCLPECFMRIHRGYIVNTEQVYSIKSNEVHMSNGETLIIPMRNSASVRGSLLSRMEKGLLSPEETHSSQKMESVNADSVHFPV